jgi:hypothetical protein
VTFPLDTPISAFELSCHGNNIHPHFQLPESQNGYWIRPINLSSISNAVHTTQFKSGIPSQDLKHQLHGVHAYLQEPQLLILDPLLQFFLVAINIIKDVTITELRLRVSFMSQYSM